MNPGIRWLSSFSLLLALAVPVAAQAGLGKFELQATIEPASCKPGDTVTLVLQATVADGWHAYGTREKTNVPVALKADKWQLGGLELAGVAEVPPGERHDTLGIEQFPLPNEFTVKQALKVPAATVAGEITVKGVLGYQICDANSCLPPSTMAFSAKVKVQGAALGTKPGLKLDPDGEKFTVTARFDPAKARAGETVKLVLEAVVDPQFHAYGSKETGNIPVALDGSKLKRSGLELVGPPVIPPGERHEQLGITTYPLPHEFSVTQTLRVPAGAKPGDVVLEGELDYQICDENMCLPPAAAPFSATLVVQEPEKVPQGTKPGLKVVADENLTIVARFDPATARAGETVSLILDAKVVAGYHAYGTEEKTNKPVSLDGAKLKLGGLEQVGEAAIPPGDKTKDAFGADSWPLPDEFQVVQLLSVPSGTKPGDIPIMGALDYVVCDENHCELPAAAAFQAVLKVEAGEARATTPPKPVGPPKNGAADDGNPFGRSWLWLILASIGGGLFALAMPCTYPMIPITFSFFTKQAERRGGKVLPLALAYGFGIVLMFVLIGVFLSAIIVDVVNHWITNTIIGAVFLFFAFVLFGWVNLQPPQFVQRMANKASAVGGLVGVFFMGATLVISSFTCTAPIVGSLLANVAKLGTMRVAFGMAIFGLTMALPFVFLSLMPTRVKKMPRSGEWMETLKVSLGFVELAAALKFASMVDFSFGWQILPRELFLLLWTTIFVLWAMYLFGILRKAGTVNEGVGAGRMASGMFVSLVATYFLFGALGFKLDFYMTNFIPGYSAESVIARGDGGKEQDDSGHVLGKHRIVLDDAPSAVKVAIVEDKLLLYNFTGFN